jgi:hypothetical protein
MPRKFLVTLIAASATICSVARAETGLSYLGLCSPSWSCENSMAAFDGLKVIRTGWLEGTFADTCHCARRLLRDPRPKEVRVHISNGACVRNARCGAYEPFAGESIQSLQEKILARDPVILGRFGEAAFRLRKRLAKSRGGLTCYASPVLESDLNDAARKILHSITVAILPNCVPVDSVVGGACLPGTVCEKHGEVKRLASPCIADMDGNGVFELSPGAFFRNSRRCDLQLVWDFPLNCNQPGGEFVSPRERDCTQSREYFISLGSYIR